MSTSFVDYSLCVHTLFVMLECICQRCNVYIVPIEFHRYFCPVLAENNDRKQANISSNILKIILLESETNEVAALKLFVL